MPSLLIAAGSGTQVQAASASTLSLKAGAGTDAAFDQGDAFGNNQRFMLVGGGDGTNPNVVGYRFPNVSIPNGSHIESAKFSLVNKSGDWIRMNVELGFEAGDNAATFTSDDSPSDRARTALQAVVDANAKRKAGTRYSLGDTKTLAASLQEVVSRPGWQSGNAVAVIGYGPAMSAYARQSFYTTLAGATLAPGLEITFTAPGSTGGGTGSTTTTTGGGVGSTTSTTGVQVTTTTMDMGSMPMPSTSTTVPQDQATGGFPDSAAMHLWKPNPKYDNCYNSDGSINADATSRIVKLHDSYSVIAPDGKRYPTWHPPTAKDPATGADCHFGHEHGRDPSLSPNWPEIQKWFAYKGDIAHSGIPFGYVNEQFDVYEAANGTPMIMRHEDHVGQKVEWEKNVSVDLVGPPVTGGTSVKSPTGVTCDYLSVVHQGTTTHDAFQNNMHEVFYFAHCSDGQDLKLAKMVKFGSAGQFTRICDPIGDRSTVIKTGFSFSNPAYPGVSTRDGDRLITDRTCLESNFLVPAGKWSMNMYEAWPGNMNIYGAGGKPIVNTVDLLFDVENSMRYYSPGATHPEMGADASKYTDEGFSMDLCYEVLPNGNKARGGQCDAATNSGAIKGIAWDDPRSAFTGTHRGLYFKPGDLTNAGGPAIWYTDPFGENAKSTPFPGSVAQNISQINSNFSQKYSGGKMYVDPTVIDNDYSAKGVHAPN